MTIETTVFNLDKVHKKEYWKKYMHMRLFTHKLF